MKRSLSLFVGLCGLLVVGWSVSHAVGRLTSDTSAAMLTREELPQSRPAPLKSAAATIESFKLKAIKAGRYRCCLKHPCDWCALHLGTCPCDAQLDHGKPVCNECKGGWYTGDGEAKGKAADQIKTFPRM